MPGNPIYILHFEWPGGVPDAADPQCELDAATEEQAKLQAALLYAVTACAEPSPKAYSIVGPDGGVVFHYRELSDLEDEPRPWPIRIPLPGRA